jgi:hypothetical protein
VGGTSFSMTARIANAISIIGSIIISRRPGHGNGA